MSLLGSLLGNAQSGAQANAQQTMQAANASALLQLQQQSATPSYSSSSYPGMPALRGKVKGDAVLDPNGTVWIWDGAQWVYGAFQNTIGATGVSQSSGMLTSQPPSRDPLEYASEVAAQQPDDPAWRFFEGVLFRVADVIAVSPEGSGSIVVQLRLENATLQQVFTLPIACASPTQWFAEHVLRFNFPNLPRAT